ncbi:MAG: hypothetical protein K0S32_4622 [Bacteroidetes bacterium]|jgi:hypothetical protein|nr:hypothetical protein [Bacteroidota bacterium]
MKLFILTIFLLLSYWSSADVIPDNSHYVYKCVKIINAENFPDFLLVGLSVHPTDTAGIGDPFLIEPKTCIEKGYKFNRLYIFAIRKDHLGNRKLDSVRWMKDTTVLRANVHIEPEGGYEDNANHLLKLDEYYMIVGFTDTSVILHKCMEVIGYNDATPTVVKNYLYQTGGAPKDDISEDRSALELLYFLRSFLITILAELIVLFILFKTLYRSLNIKNGILLFTGFISSFATLPYAWFVLPTLIEGGPTYIIVSEISVTLIESFMIYGLLKINYKKAIIISVICNLISFLIGVGLNCVGFI